MKVGDFVVGQFDNKPDDDGFDERLCLVTGVDASGDEDWAELTFARQTDDPSEPKGEMLKASLPGIRIKPVGFDFSRLEDECDTQGDLSHLAALSEQRRR